MIRRQSRQFRPIGSRAERSRFNRRNAGAGYGRGSAGRLIGFGRNTNMLPLSAVQETLYGVLTTALAPVPVLDHAGVNQVYPYVTIGEAIASHSDTLGEQGVDVEITVHVWSR